MTPTLCNACTADAQHLITSRAQGSSRVGVIDYCEDCLHHALTEDTRAGIVLIELNFHHKGSDHVHDNAEGNI